VGAQAPYPIELHGVNREGEERRKKRDKEEEGDSRKTEDSP
jgi:hypothetical protein